MKPFRLDIFLKPDKNDFSATEECLDVKKVIHTRGGHLRVIFQNNSEVVYNASVWQSYVKTVTE